jgi:WD40 repeat protein
MQVRRLGLCGFLLILGLGLSTAPAQDGKKRPIPSPAAQAKVIKLIQELYGDDLAKATDELSVKVRLGQTLLQEGRDTVDDGAGRYVLLKEAHRLAAEGGDIATALQAAEELAQSFEMPAAELFAMKVRTLSTAASAKQAPGEAYQRVVDQSLALLEDTLAADDFPSSLALLTAADKAAIKLRNVGLVSSIRKRLDEVHALEKQYAQWEPAAKVLAKNPDDANANAQMGYYQALVKGDWEKGLPMLARGDGTVSSLAQAEIAAKSAAAVAKVAAAWAEYAKHSKDDRPRLQGLLHAYQLYLQALPFADDRLRATIDGELHAITSVLPPEYRAGEITTELRKIDSTSGPVYDAAFSPDGRKVLATGYDGSLRLYDTRTGKELRSLHGHVGKVWTVVFCPDGRHVVSGGFDGTVRLWELTTARDVKRFQAHGDYVRSVCVSADGKHVLSGGDDRRLMLGDLSGSTPSSIPGGSGRNFDGHDHTIWSVALSRDGKHALSASLDKTVRLWDVETGKQLKKLEGHHDTVLGVAFTPDGRHAISGSTDKTLMLWDLDSGKPVRTFTGHTGYVQHVAVSPDGRFALSAGADHTVRLWDIGAGTLLRTLEGHQGPVWSVAFSRDGRLALSAGDDRCVRIWGAAR